MVGITPSAMRKRIYRKTMPVVHHGRSNRIRLSDVMNESKEYEETQRVWEELRAKYAQRPNISQMESIEQLGEGVPKQQ